MVTEAIIEETIAHFESDQQVYESALAGMIEEQPALLAFISQESNDVLTEEEKDLFWYILLVVVSSSSNFGAEIGELSDNLLASKEEACWEVLNDQPRGNFREKVTPFFENYSQEDLLAFVEDSLELDEESPVTSVGREVIFISAKAVIDSIFDL